MWKNLKKRAAIFFTGVLALSALAGCGNTEGNKETSASAQENNQESAKVIQVAGVTGKKPYTFVDDNNEYSGYDFELLKKIDEALPQYKFEYNALAQDALLVGLKTDKYDLATCSFYGTKERFETYNHSEKLTGLSDARLIVKEGETEINSLDDIASKGKKLAPIPTDDARYTLIKNYNEKHPDNQIIFEGATEKSATTADILKAVANGDYDAAIYPYTSFNSVQKELSLPLKVTDSVGLFPTVFLYSKSDENVQLQKDVDEVLEKFRNDGTLSELSKKWYGEDVFELDGAKDVTSVKYWED